MDRLTQIEERLNNYCAAALDSAWCDAKVEWEEHNVEDIRYLLEEVKRLNQKYVIPEQEKKAEEQRLSKVLRVLPNGDKWTVGNQESTEKFLDFALKPDDPRKFEKRLRKELEDE